MTPNGAGQLHEMGVGGFLKGRLAADYSYGFSGKQAAELHREVS
jgi:hypothetical protein